MNFTDEGLRILSRKWYGEGAAIKSRAEMEALLRVMIRVALRTGLGRPEVVRWVRKTLPTLLPASHRGEKVDVDWAAPRLARLLCSQMMQHVQASAGSAGGVKRA